MAPEFMNGNYHGWPCVPMDKLYTSGEEFMCRVYSSFENGSPLEILESVEGIASTVGRNAIGIPRF